MINGFRNFISKIWLSSLTCLGFRVTSFFLLGNLLFPVQYDAAVNPETAKIKLKGKAGAVAGKVYDGPLS